MARLQRCRVCLSAIMISLALFVWDGAAHAMGRIPKKDYDAKVAQYEKEKAELQKQKQECETSLASAQKKMADDEAGAKSKIDSLEANNAQLLKDMDSSKSGMEKRLAELEQEKQKVEKDKQEIENQRSAEMEKLKSTYDNLVSDMKKEIDQGSIQITRLQNRLSVNLVDKILFNSGEAEVNDQGKQVLKKVANILKNVRDKQIRIEGHTDNVPIGGALKEKFPSNWELSTARATNVCRYLQDEGGIDPKVLSASGYAQFRPIADNSAPEGRAKNRRIEIALVPLEGK